MDNLVKLIEQLTALLGRLPNKWEVIAFIEEGPITRALIIRNKFIPQNLQTAAYRRHNPI